MSYSQVTKNALARSLKKLMLTKPLHKITIQQLTGDCGVTRHTFYNHFKDIYELLGWVYQTEIIGDLGQYHNCTGWKQGFLSVLYYTQSNKTICLNTFHSLGREHLEGFLYGVIYGVIIKVVEELDAQERERASRQAKQEIADFYALAVLEQVIHWLKAGADTDPVQVVDKVARIMDGSISRGLANYQTTPVQ
ncbi:TetR/AcrR family transcriptional regulator C-terminal domain-containing protein [Paenibacillus sp. S150]|uniref:TetR/AcrR family transcriptional regulator C-terminal domain-containing protein n=1 Tax=Paenibacillus sp. S150 TaxID=2749826 RepID=UPI001C5A5474|nr:TetR/AcrR family transcriptional regulator C-terminal domain-containing protein [Paenibacillus sp. S150]MBW4082925.1 TetR/AcrR family transcriptional regulator C-terminal domain-containing protein [Paenibacillus sp. S150]